MQMKFIQYLVKTDIQTENLIFKNIHIARYILTWPARDREKRKESRVIQDRRLQTIKFTHPPLPPKFLVG